MSLHRLVKYDFHDTCVVQSFAEKTDNCALTLNYCKAFSFVKLGDGHCVQGDAQRSKVETCFGSLSYIAQTL